MYYTLFVIYSINLLFNYYTKMTFITHKIDRKYSEVS